MVVTGETASQAVQIWQISADWTAARLKIYTRWGSALEPLKTWPRSIPWKTPAAVRALPSLADREVTSSYAADGRTDGRRPRKPVSPKAAKPHSAEGGLEGRSTLCPAAGRISACCSGTQLGSCASEGWGTPSCCHPSSPAHPGHVLFCRARYEARCHRPGFPALLQPGEELLPFWPRRPETIQGLAGLCLFREQTDEILSQVFVWCLSPLPQKMGNALFPCAPQ